MVIIAAQLVVLGLGFTILGLSAWGIYAPGSLVTTVARVMEQRHGIYVAVVVRLILGAALILSASGSRYPLVFEAVGWLAITAAVGLILLGRKGSRRVVVWFENFSTASVRIWLVFGIAFSALVIYGVL